MHTKIRARILFASLCVAAVAFSQLPLAQLHAEVFPAQAQAAPQTPAAKPPQSNGKILEYKGIVVSFSTASITVRNQQNERMLQSFTYTPQLHDKVVAMMQKGGYQNGDKVTIKYAEDTTVARDISGKPSKPKHF